MTPRNTKQAMSRPRALQPEKQTGQSRSALLSEAQKRFELRLAASVVDVFNRKTPPSAAFDWVPSEQHQIAKLAGVEVRWGSDVPRMRDNIDTLKFLEMTIAFTIAIGFGERGLDPDSKTDRLFLKDVRSQLGSIQIVTFWNLLEAGHLEEVSIPRLDTTERCIAYVLGLMLLDRHGLRRGIKACRSSIDPDPYAPDATAEEIARNTHFFIDIPNSKRQFCSEKHAQTWRKRVQRLREKWDAKHD